MKITYERMEPQRLDRRRYAVVVDGQHVGIVRKPLYDDEWFFERDGGFWPRKLRQDAVAAGIAGLVSAAS